jgi:hypothetical protein
LTIRRNGVTCKASYFPPNPLDRFLAGAIDEYLLSVKPETAPVPGKGLAVQAWDSLALKPGVLGFSVDLKKLFGAVLDLKKLLRGKSQL